MRLVLARSRSRSPLHSAEAKHFKQHVGHASGKERLRSGESGVRNNG